MVSEPQTESGRALLRDYLSPGGTTMFLSDILAIEQEAASKAVAEVRRFTRHLTWCGYAEADRVKEWIGGCTCGLDAALIASERER